MEGKCKEEQRIAIGDNEHILLFAYKKLFNWKKNQHRLTFPNNWRESLDRTNTNRETCTPIPEVSECVEYRNTEKRDNCGDPQRSEKKLKDNKDRLLWNQRKTWAPGHNQKVTSRRKDANPGSINEQLGSKKTINRLGMGRKFYLTEN